MQVAGADDLTLLDKDDGVAGDFDLAKEMRIKEDGGAAVAFVANNVANEMAAHGVKAGGGLIEEDEVGFVDERLREADALHHAFRKTTETTIAMRGEADEIEIGGNAIVKLSRSEPAEAAVESKEL